LLDSMRLASSKTKGLENEHERALQARRLQSSSLGLLNRRT